MLGGEALGVEALGVAGANEPRDDETFNEEETLAGYNFIEMYGPKANNKNQFNIWSKVWTSRPDSKIYKWSRAEVKDSLANYAKGHNGARTIDHFPVPLKKLEPILLDKVWIPMLRSHHAHGTLLVGRTKVGKSTISKSNGLAISGFHIKQGGRTDLAPSLLTGNRLDFFRMEPGIKEKPCVADEIRMQNMPAEDLKLFANPGEEDALVWARWGGAQFDPSQHRGLNVNPYDKELEKTLVSASSVREEITYAQLLRLIAVNWPKDAVDEDIEAYMTRLHIVLMSDKWIYYRLATDGRNNVPRMPYPNPQKPDLFIPEVAETLKKFKKDRSYKPPDYDSDFAWDVRLLETLSTGVQIPRTVTITGPKLFSDGASVTQYVHPELTNLSSTSSAHFCGTLEDSRELQTILRAKTLESGLDGSTVDLVTPPTSPRRVSGFCGDNEDAMALQSILWESAKNISGQSFVITDDDELKTTSPPRKYTKLYTKTPDRSASVDEHMARVAAGLSASSNCPEPVGGSGTMPDCDVDEEDVFGHGCGID